MWKLQLPWQSNCEDSSFLVQGLWVWSLVALQPKNQTIKQKQYCNKFNKDFKNGPHQNKWKKFNYDSNTKMIWTDNNANIPAWQIVVDYFSLDTDQFF